MGSTPVVAQGQGPTGQEDETNGLESVSRDEAWGAQQDIGCDLEGDDALGCEADRDTIEDSALGAMRTTMARSTSLTTMMSGGP